MSSELARPPGQRMLLPARLLHLASDERLVEHVRAGSERAFEVLFDRHRRPLLAFCHHMLGSREDAEDAVQHVFLDAYRDVLRSEKPIDARPWLFTIARNRCLSMLRARRERPVAEAPFAGESVAAEVDRREDLRALLVDLARLPDEQRIALLLTELSGVSQHEIGRLLGCRQQRVKALVFQARSALLAGRTARETPCDEIRGQLATLRGGALRRTVLRQHLRDCPGCRDFRDAVRRQRRGPGAWLPVGSGLGLKQSAFGALFGSGSAGAGGAAFQAGLLGGGLVARTLVTVAITTGGTAAGVTAVAHSVTHGGGPRTAAPEAAAERRIERASAEPKPALAYPVVPHGRPAGRTAPERWAGAPQAAPGAYRAPPEPAARADEPDHGPGEEQRAEPSQPAGAAPALDAAQGGAEAEARDPAKPAEPRPRDDPPGKAEPPKQPGPAGPGSPGQGHGPGGSDTPPPANRPASPGEPRDDVHGRGGSRPPAPRDRPQHAPPHVNRPAQPDDHADGPADGHAEAPSPPAHDDLPPTVKGGRPSPPAAATPGGPGRERSAEDGPTA